jgi:hypothetical protein
MVWPSDIRGTDNVYHAFLAVLQVVSAHSTILTPLFGMGYGKLDATECADAIADAIFSFSQGKRASDYDRFAIVSPSHIITMKCVCPQRADQYCNRELPA